MDLIYITRMAQYLKKEGWSDSRILSMIMYMGNGDGKSPAVNTEEPVHRKGNDSADNTAVETVVEARPVSFVQKPVKDDGLENEEKTDKSLEEEKAAAVADESGDAEEDDSEYEGEVYTDPDDEYADDEGIDETVVIGETEEEFLGVKDLYSDLDEDNPSAAEDLVAHTEMKEPAQDSYREEPVHKPSDNEFVGEPSDEEFVDEPSDDADGFEEEEVHEPDIEEREEEAEPEPEESIEPTAEVNTEKSADVKAAAEKVVHTKTVPVQKISGGESLTEMRKRIYKDMVIDNMPRNDFMYCVVNVKIFGADGTTCDGQIFVAPMRIDVEKPELLGYLVKKDKDREIARSEEDGNTLTFKLYGYPLTVRGTIADGKFNVVCTLPEHYAKDGTKLVCDYKPTNGKKGHIVLFDDETNTFVHIIPLTSKNSPARGGEATFIICCVEKEDGSHMISVGTPKKRVTFMNGKKRVQVTPRWDENKILRVFVD